MLVKVLLSKILVQRYNLILIAYILQKTEIDISQPNSGYPTPSNVNVFLQLLY